MDLEVVIYAEHMWLQKAIENNFKMTINKFGEAAAHSLP